MSLGHTRFFCVFKIHPSWMIQIDFNQETFWNETLENWRQTTQSYASNLHTVVETLFCASFWKIQTHKGEMLFSFLCYLCFAFHILATNLFKSSIVWEGWKVRPLGEVTDSWRKKNLFCLCLFVKYISTTFVLPKVRSWTWDLENCFQESKTSFAEKFFTDLKTEKSITNPGSDEVKGLDPIKEEEPYSNNSHLKQKISEYLSQSMCFNSSIGLITSWHMNMVYGKSTMTSVSFMWQISSED